LARFSHAATATQIRSADHNSIRPPTFPIQLKSPNQNKTSKINICVSLAKSRISWNIDNMFANLFVALFAGMLSDFRSVIIGSS